MKLSTHLKPVLFFSVLLIGSSGCERTRHTETNTSASNTDTVAVSRTETTTETKTKIDTSAETKPKEELNEFRNWVNNKTAQADSNASRRWPKVKEEFRTRTARMETHLDSLSEDSKREYAELKKRYELWEKKQDDRTAQPLKEAALVKWRKTLLGDHQNLNTVNGANARETYLLFMGIVRAKRSNWTLTDWDYVDHVYSELNGHKSEIESKIPVADRVKIKSLQAEYLALEAGADAQDAYENVKKK
jgi:hypothetical protein